MLLTAVTAGALGLGVLIGLALGALGGGGSILTVPALVFLLGLSAQEATTGSLVIVGVAAALASVEHARAGHTRWRQGFTLAAVGVPASILGSRLNQRVDPDALLLSFAAVMVLAAGGMLLRSRGAQPPPAPDAPPADLATAHPGTGTTTLSRTEPKAGVTAGRTSLAVAGLGIGFLTGFLGVGGGFLAVPVLVVLLGVPMPVAVGTSLLVIALNSGVALAARASDDTFVWAVIIPFTIAAVAGSVVGKGIADRVAAATLTRAFAALLLLVAGYVAVQALLGTA